jgi:hypothetical protein
MIFLIFNLVMFADGPAPAASKLMGAARNDKRAA